MTDKSVKSTKPWVKYLLVVSLGLNLAIAGLFIGAKVAGHDSGKPPHPPGASGMRHFMHALPNSKRREVRQYFKLNREKMHANGYAMRGAMENIQAVIVAQPFDADALNAAFDQQRTHIITMTTDAQTAFVEIIAGMTDDERKQYVANMETLRLKWREKRKKK
jgi:uncharacterized membrane protein